MAKIRRAKKRSSFFFPCDNYIFSSGTETTLATLTFLVGSVCRGREIENNGLFREKMTLRLKGVVVEYNFLGCQVDTLNYSSILKRSLKVRLKKKVHFRQPHP